MHLPEYLLKLALDVNAFFRERIHGPKFSQTLLLDGKKKKKYLGILGNAL